MMKLSTPALFLTALAAGNTFAASELQEESDVRFAFYSSSWGGNTVDNIRLLAFNSTSTEVNLDSVTFLKGGESDDDIHLQLGLPVPAGGYAELELPYIDLLGNNECIERTMAENWRLAEISNYTLNPSVRNLIIQDTSSFRIYQCVETIRTRISGSVDGDYTEKEEWVLYHFESRLDF